MSDLKTFRPGGTRVVAYAVAVIMLVVTAAISWALPDEIYFTTAETLTLWAMILVMLAMLHGVGRSFVRVSDEGLEVLNGYKTHHVPWSDIKGFAMNNGAPWPTLVTHDDDRINLFGIQGSDGKYARDAVAYLRGRLES